MLRAIHRRAAQAPVGALVVMALACLALFQYRDWLLAPGVVPDARWRGYTPREIGEFLAHAGATRQRLYAWSEITLDAVFPLVYGLLLWRLIARSMPAGVGLLAIWLPALAVVADWLENALLACLAWERCALGMAAAASLLTRAKWALIGLSVLALVPGALRVLRHRWPRILARLPYVYLLRVPLLLGLTLLALPALAMGRLRNVLANLFVLTAGELFWVAVATVFAAMTVLATARVVLLHGAARFGVESAGASAAIPARLLLVPLLLAAWVLGLAVLASVREIPPDERAVATSLVLLLAALGGGLAAFVVVWLLEVLRFLFARSGGPPGDREMAIPDLMMPSWSVPRFIHQTHLPLPRLDLARRLEAQAGGRDRLAGYVHPHTGHLLAGHVFALLIFAALAILYGLGFVLDAPGPEHGSRVPALVYLLALVTLPAWVLGAAAFLLDRYRVPVLVVPGVMLALSFVAPTDHFFPTTAGMARPPTARPAQLVARLPGCRLTVVAASGGGIRAAGWAAQVLTGLHRQVAAFTPSLRLVSAVSGGSVGTMYFVGAFEGPAGPADAALDEIVELSMRSSLNDVAWGFAYPDLWRTFTPVVWDDATDRAWALEQAWRRGWRFRDDTLRQWRDLTGEGRRPAVAFNATIVETGQRLALATFDRPSSGMETLMFDDVYDTRDIPIVVAARLSATFTYVTPVARARDETARKFHVADGGYQDNYGVATLVDWLNAALLDDPDTWIADEQGQACGGRLRVAVVRIASPEADPEAVNRSWAFQVGAPAQVLLAIRTAGPRSRNEMELALLAHAGLGRRLGVFCFDYANDDNPLSWHLSAAQRRRIREAWDTEDNRAAARRLREFFEGDGTRAFAC